MLKMLRILSYSSYIHMSVIKMNKYCCTPINLLNLCAILDMHNELRDGREDYVLKQFSDFISTC
jgi:hypothetical protein